MAELDPLILSTEFVFFHFIAIVCLVNMSLEFRVFLYLSQVYHNIQKFFNLCAGC